MVPPSTMIIKKCWALASHSTPPYKFGVYFKVFLDDGECPSDYTILTNLVIVLLTANMFAWFCSDHYYNKEYLSKDLKLVLRKKWLIMNYKLLYL